MEDQKHLGLWFIKEASVAAFKKAIGKQIKALRLSEDAGDGALCFEFDDGYKMHLRDEGRSCCESRYLRTDDNLQDFIGATLVSAEVRDGGTSEMSWGEHEIAFLVVETSKGRFTICSHNEHNGYYGGICIRAIEVEA